MINPPGKKHKIKSMCPGIWGRILDTILKA